MNRIKLFSGRKPTNMIEKLQQAVEAARKPVEKLVAIQKKEAECQRQLTALGLQAAPDYLAISRLTGEIEAVRADCAKAQAAAAPLLEKVEDIYHQVRDYFNQQCATRRAIARASFLTACLPFFDHDEGATAEALQGILTRPQIRASRAGWNGYFNGADSPAQILGQAECFIGHLEEHAGELGLPLE